MTGTNGLLGCLNKPIKHRTTAIGQLTVGTPVLRLSHRRQRAPRGGTAHSTAWLRSGRSQILGELDIRPPWVGKKGDFCLRVWNLPGRRVEFDAQRFKPFDKLVEA